MQLWEMDLMCVTRRSLTLTSLSPWQVAVSLPHPPDPLKQLVVLLYFPCSSLNSLTSWLAPVDSSSDHCAAD